MKRIVILLLLLSSCAHTGEGPGETVRSAPASVAVDTAWSGSWEIAGAVTVEKGAVLRLAPGARLFFRDRGSRLFVAGRIVAEGTAADPVVFAPSPGAAEGWGGILMSGGSKDNVLSACVIRGAGDVTLYGATVTVRGCIFEGNGVALDLTGGSSAEIADSAFRGNGTGVECRLQSRAVLRESRFEGQENWAVAFSSGAGGEVRGSSFTGGRGILVKQGRDVLVSGNAFEDAETAIITDQVAQDVRIVDNTFTGGASALQAVNFSTPYVACGVFRGLDTAVTATRFSRPLIANCLFAGNGRAIEASNKSNFPIRNNMFRDNREALFLDLSAYPRIEGNNFTGNGRDITLGIYMSAHWEKEVGSRGISAGRARNLGSPNVPGVDRTLPYDGLVDASGNWWGRETTDAMKALGPEGDVPSIDDVFDRPTVSYPGFGPGEYRLDRVVYAPWRTEPVTGAGPLPAGCGDIGPGGAVERAR